MITFFKAATVFASVTRLVAEEGGFWLPSLNYVENSERNGKRPALENDAIASAAVIEL